MIKTQICCINGALLEDQNKIHFITWFFSFRLFFSLLRRVVVVIVMVQNDISSSYAHTSLNWLFQPLYHKNNIIHSNRCRKKKSYRKHHKYSINWNLSNGLWVHWTWTWTYQKSMFCAMQCSFSLAGILCVCVCMSEQSHDLLN